MFFRNNHFSVLFNRDHKLFMLVTDEGFVDQPSAVWELLDAVRTLLYSVQPRSRVSVFDFEGCWPCQAFTSVYC